MRKCDNIKGESIMARLKLMDLLINKNVDISKSKKEFKDYLDSLSNYDDDSDKKTFIKDCIKFANSINSKAKFELSDFDESLTERNLQNQAIKGLEIQLKSAGAINIDEDKISLVQMNTLDDLLTIFNSNSDLMSKFFIRLRGDLIDLTLFGANNTFNSSKEQLNENVKEWKKVNGNSLTDEELDVILNNRSEYSNAQMASMIASGDQTFYKAFVSKHFDKLLFLTKDSLLSVNSKGVYQPNLKSSLRNTWTTNEFVSFFDEMGDFTKQIIQTRKEYDVNGNETGNTLDINKSFYLINKLAPFVDRTNPSYVGELLNRLITKLRAKDSFDSDKTFSDLSDEFNASDLNTIFSVYTHFYKPKDINIAGIDSNSDAFKVKSFNERSLNSKPLITSSSDMDYFELIDGVLQKQTGNSYSQVVYDYENNTFKTENLKTGLVNSKKFELLNTIEFRATKYYNKEMMERIVHASGLKLEDNEIKKGSEKLIDLKTGDVTNTGQVNKKALLKIFKYFISNDPTIDMDEFMKYAQEKGRKENDVITDLSKIASLMYRCVIADSDSKPENIYIDGDKDYNQYKRIIGTLAEYMNMQSGAEYKAVIQNADGKALPAFGQLNMVKDIKSLISLVKKGIKRIDSNRKSPLEGNFIIDNVDYVLDPVTNTVISYRGEQKAVADANAMELFHNNFVLQYLDNIAHNDYKIAVQPTTYSDKSKQTAVVVDGKAAKIGRYNLNTATIDLIKSEYIKQTYGYYKTLSANVLETINKVVDGDYKSLSKIPKVGSEGFYTLKELRSMAHAKGLNIVEALFFEKDGSVNNLLTTMEKMNEYEIYRQIQNDIAGSLKLMRDNNVSIDYNDIKTIIKDLDNKIPGFKSESFEADWVNKKTNRVIFINSENNINPLFERYFYEKNLISESYRNLIMGSPACHALKAKGVSLTGNLANRYVSGTKRAVGMQATFHPYKLGMYNGVSYYDNIAYVSDPTLMLYNQLGNTQKQDVTDGASISTFLSTILKNNSLLDQGGQIHHKSIGMMINPEDGTFMLMKHADHSITNERIRNSIYAKYDYEKIIKKMLDIPFKEDFDITKDFNGKNILSGLDAKFVVYNGGEHSINKLTGLVKTDTGYKITYRDIDGKSERELNQPINSLYDLWKILGGANSCDSHGVFNNNSWFNLAEFVNRVGSYKNQVDMDKFIGSTQGYDYNSHRLELNKLRYDDDNKIEYNPTTHRPSADSLYQPLKHAFITQITFASAEKVGAINVNGEESLRDDSPLNYFDKWSNLHTGLQLDHEHSIDDSHITEPTQMLSAIFFNGDASTYNKQIRTIIKALIERNIAEYLTKDVSDLKYDINKIKKAIGDTLIQELAKKDLSGFAINFSKEIAVKVNKILLEANKNLNLNNHKGYNDLIDSLAQVTSGAIPFSDSGLFKTYLNTINNKITSLAIRRKFAGAGNVLSPQDLFLTVHEDENGRVRIAEEFKGKPLEEILKFASINKKDVKPGDVIKNEDGTYTVLDSYKKWIEFSAIPNKIGYIKVYNYPRRLMSHSFEFQVEVLNEEGTPYTFTKNTLGCNHVKLSNYPDLINQYIKDGLKEKAKELYNEYIKLFNKSCKIYRLGQDFEIVKSFNNHISESIQKIDDSNYKFILTKDEKMMLKNLQLKYDKDLKEGKYYVCQDDINNCEDFPLQLKLIDSYNNNTPLQVINYKERPAEIIAPANLRENFMIEEGDNIEDIDSPNFFYNKLLQQVDKASNLAYKPEAMLPEHNGDNIYIYNLSDKEEVLNGLKYKASYVYTGESNSKYILDNKNNKVSNVGDNEFYTVKDDDGNSIKFAFSNNIDSLAKFDDNKGRYNSLVDFSIDFNAQIERNAKELYDNFQLSLNGVMCRIPSQTKQSGMPFKYVGFLKTENNISFVPAENLWLTGGDFDIDKIIQLLLDFNRNGTINKHSDYFVTKDHECLLQSYALPIADGVERTFKVAQLGDTANITTEDITYLAKLIDWHEDNENPIDHFDVNRCADILNRISNLKELVLPINAESNLDEISSFINDYFVEGAKYLNDSKALESSLLGMMFHAYNDGRNNIHTYAPMEMDDIKDSAKPSSKGTVMLNFSPNNVMTDVLMQITNMVGKSGIAIAATGQKALSAIINRYLDLKPDNMDNIKFNSNFANEVAEAIGKKAPGNNYVVAGLDLKNMLPDYGDYLRNLGLTEEEIAKKMEEAYITSASELSVSQLISAATDNAKELLLGKMNASTDTLGMYVYSAIMGVSLGNFTSFMISPEVDQILDAAKQSMFHKETQGSTIDKAIIEVSQGYKDPLKYSDRFSYGNYKNIYEAVIPNYDKLTKEIKNAIQQSQLGFLIHGTKSIDSKSKNIKELDSIYNLMVNRLNSNEIIKIKIGNSTSYSSEELELLEDIEDEFSSSDKINLTSNFYKWYEDSKKMNLPSADGLKRIELFKKIKEESEAIKVLGQVLGANQGIKTDPYDFYKYQNVLNNYVSKRMAKSFKNNTDAVNQKLYPNFYKDNGFSYSKFMLDEEYKQAAINEYTNLLRNTDSITDQVPHELNILEILSASDHFMAMASMPALLNNEIYKPTSAKYRIVDNIIDEIVNNGLFDFEKSESANDEANKITPITNYKFRKAIDKDTYMKLNSYADDLIIGNFLSSESININAGDYYTTIQDGKLYNKKATKTTTLNLNTIQGREEFTSWFENKMLNLQSDDNYINNGFLNNVSVDMGVDPINNQEYFYIKPILNYNNSLNESQMATVNDMVKGLKDLNAVKIGDYKFHDLLFLYDLIVNRNRKSRTSFTYFTSNAFSKTDPSLISNRYVQYVTDFDQDPTAGIEFKVEDFALRMIGKKLNKGQKATFGKLSIGSQYNPETRKRNLTFYNGIGENMKETVPSDLYFNKNILLDGVLGATNIKIQPQAYSDLLKNTSLISIKINC